MVFQKQTFKNKQGIEMEKKKKPWASEKHIAALAGTIFEKCATCPGTVGKLDGDGNMRCSRAGAVPTAVTGEQAKTCNGKKPTLRVEEKKPAPIFAGLRLLRTV